MPITGLVWLSVGQRDEFCCLWPWPRGRPVSAASLKSLQEEVRKELASVPCPSTRSEKPFRVDTTQALVPTAQSGPWSGEPTAGRGGENQGIGTAPQPWPRPWPQVPCCSSPAAAGGARLGHRLRRQCGGGELLTAARRALLQLHRGKARPRPSHDRSGSPSSS